LWLFVFVLCGENLENKGFLLCFWVFVGLLLGMFDLINKDCAACIYTGMMTDTGSFTYNSNKPEIYTIISELIPKAGYYIAVKAKYVLRVYYTVKQT
jgi:hypothetical protein